MVKEKALKLYSSFCVKFCHLRSGKIMPIAKIDFSFWSGGVALRNVYIYTENGSQYIHIDRLGNFCLDPRKNAKILNGNSTEGAFFEWFMAEFSAKYWQ